MQHRGGFRGQFREILREEVPETIWSNCRVFYVEIYPYFSRIIFRVSLKSLVLN